MNELPLSKRVFPFRLASWLPRYYASYLRWLRHLLERLGHDGALSIWQDVYQGYEDERLLPILRTGWKEVAPEERIEVGESIAGSLSRFFPAAIEGV
jgi:hypothetical protein